MEVADGAMTKMAILMGLTLAKGTTALLFNDGHRSSLPMARCQSPKVEQNDAKETMPNGGMTNDQWRNDQWHNDQCRNDHCLMHLTFAHWALDIHPDSRGRQRDTSFRVFSGRGFR
jgi:hypothetical protein